MIVIEKISLNLSQKLGMRLNKNEEEILILNYGMFMILHTFIAIVATVFMGIVTGTFVEMMIVSITSAWLKRYSGGIHASSPERCIIIGLVLSYLLAKISININENINMNGIFIFVIISFLFSYYIIYKKCPVGSKNKPLKNQETRKKLKIKSFKLITLYLLTVLSLICISTSFNIVYIKKIVLCIIFGTLVQIIVLTKVGEFLIKLLDNTLNIGRILKRL